MILILGGTTEAFKVAEELHKQSREFILTAATEYGLDLFKQHFGSRVVKIQFNNENLKRFLTEKKIKEIIDCTHPYAEIISAVAKSVAEEMDIQYRAVKRAVDTEVAIDYEKAVFVNSLTEAAEFILRHKIKRPLFTTGSKDLSFVSLLKEIDFFVRVLPYEVSIKRCRDSGIKGSNIIAMEGPFSVQMNMAIIKEFNIDCIVTKLSGKEGGFFEKLESAKRSGIWLIILRPPQRM